MTSRRTERRFREQERLSGIMPLTPVNLRPVRLNPELWPECREEIEEIYRDGSLDIASRRG